MPSEMPSGRLTLAPAFLLTLGERGSYDRRHRLKSEP